MPSVTACGRPSVHILCPRKSRPVSAPSSPVLGGSRASRRPRRSAAPTFRPWEGGSCSLNPADEEPLSDTQDEGNYWKSCSSAYSAQATTRPATMPGRTRHAGTLFVVVGNAPLREPAKHPSQAVATPRSPALKLGPDAGYGAADAVDILLLDKSSHAPKSPLDTGLFSRVRSWIQEEEHVQGAKEVGPEATLRQGEVQLPRSADFSHEPSRQRRQAKVDSRGEAPQLQDPTMDGHCPVQRESLVEFRAAGFEGRRTGSASVADCRNRWVNSTRWWDYHHRHMRHGLGFSGSASRPSTAPGLLGRSREASRIMAAQVMNKYSPRGGSSAAERVARFRRAVTHPFTLTHLACDVQGHQDPCQHARPHEDQGGPGTAGEWSSHHPSQHTRISGMMSAEHGQQHPGGDACPSILDGDATPRQIAACDDADEVEAFSGPHSLAQGAGSGEARGQGSWISPEGHNDTEPRHLSGLT
eukprot:jgi/Botrbrau1/17313/Bobra.0015s0062.2